MRQRKFFDNLDWPTVFLYIGLVLFGWLSIYSATYDGQSIDLSNLGKDYNKQLIFIIVSGLVAIVVLLLDSKMYVAFSWLLYAITILLLIAALFLAPEISGARSWFPIGPFKFQPSEFAKAATCLVLAKYLSGLNVSFKGFKTKVIASFLIFLPLILIVLQGDAGSALVYGSLIFVLYRVGLPSYFLILILAFILIGILALLFDSIPIIIGFSVLAALVIGFSKRKMKVVIAAIPMLLFIAGLVLATDYMFNNVLKPHQQSRINVLIGNEVDLKGAGYNVHQSKIAIGSGGFTGKGFLKGTQIAGNFIPEQHTDFIFCTIGEQWGFLGSLALFGLFLGLLFRILVLAERQRSKFSQIYAYGVASIIFFHFLVNIGMTIGLMPVIGIPLPFISYGGSSLLSFTILLFILLRLDASRLDVLR